VETIKTFLLKITSRKFILAVALFIFAQHFKSEGKIGDWAWLAASFVSTFGYQLLKLYFGWKDKCGASDPIPGGE
jgi:hypothetical protein